MPTAKVSDISIYYEVHGEGEALVIGGALDWLNPIENQRTLASSIAHAELVIMENLGHGLYIEGTEEINRAMLDFLKRHPRPS